MEVTLRGTMDAVRMQLNRSCAQGGKGHIMEMGSPACVVEKVATALTLNDEVSVYKMELGQDVWVTDQLITGTVRAVRDAAVNSLTGPNGEAAELRGVMLVMGTGASKETNVYVVTEGVLTMAAKVLIVLAKTYRMFGVTNREGERMVWIHAPEVDELGGGDAMQGLVAAKAGGARMMVQVLAHHAVKRCGIVGAYGLILPTKVWRKDVCIHACGGGDSSVEWD